MATENFRAGRLGTEGTDSTDFSFALIELDDLSIFAISPAAIEQLGLAQTNVVGRPVAELFAPEERDAAIEAIIALRSGVIDSYWAHRTITSPADANHEVQVWLRVRAVEIDGRRMALSEVNVGDEPRPIRFAATLDERRSAIAAGLTDESGNIVSLNDAFESLTGEARHELLRTPLGQTPTQRALLRRLSRGESEGESRAVAMHFQLPRRAPRARDIGCVVSRLVGTNLLFFMAVAFEDFVVRGAIDGSGDLERRMWKVTDELSEMMRLGSIRSSWSSEVSPEFETLTDRQSEILRRILRGQGVPSIAADLFISASTVRSSLSAIYRKCGVRSQSELLQLVIESSTRTT